jgi:large subunit ribosomal protein L18
MKLDKKQNRLRRAAKGRAKIRELGATRLSVHRTPRHIYAQIIAGDGGTVLAAASTLEADVRKNTKSTGNAWLQRRLSVRIAERQRLPVSIPWHSIAPVSVITDA